MERSAADNAGRGVRPRRYETLLALAWFLFGALVGGQVVGTRLYLVYVYGWHRVWSERLHIVQTSKREPWLVSNGDLIVPHDWPQIAIMLGCIAVFFLPGYLLTRLLLPLELQASPTPGTTTTTLHRIEVRRVRAIEVQSPHEDRG